MRRSGRPRNVTPTIDVSRWLTAPGRTLRGVEFSLTATRTARLLTRRPHLSLPLHGLHPGELRGFVLSPVRPGQVA
jgi:hypothetical protein